MQNGILVLMLLLVPGRAMQAQKYFEFQNCVVHVGSKEELPGGIPKTMSAGRPAENDGVPTCDGL